MHTSIIKSLTIIISCCLLFVKPTQAISKVDVAVKIILASNESQYLDPQLNNLVEELQSVIRYTSYRLLEQQQIRLGLKEAGTVMLPNNRFLQIAPIRFLGNRADLRLAIIKGTQKSFQTNIQLINRRSVTIGGLKYSNGYLLLNIFNSF